MDPITLAALEYEELKRLLAPRLKSPLGHRALAALAPSSDRGEVAVLRARAREGLAYLHEFRAPSPGEVEDPAETLVEAEPEGAILDPVKIARLTAVIRAGVAFRDEISVVRTRYPRLWDVAGSIPNLKPLLGDLASKVNPEGKVEDRASPDLERIRGRIASLEGRLQRMLRSFLDREAVKGAMQDAFVTIRSGRFVIPVRVEARKEVAGIIHGASSTGATVFVEPMEMVEANNELVTLRDEEETEIRRILLALTARLRSHLPELRALSRVLGEADLLGACALFARDFGCEPAEDSESVVLHGARHPTLQSALESRAGRIVPLDVEIPSGGQVLILSGPNTGGKTAALKTIGLLALMNQSGILLPVSRAALPVFAQVLADVGDRQSITENLSTFSARMLRVAEMSRALRSPALVLLDEVGAGTDPEEGGALAVTIVDHFRRRGASVIATTHHAALKIYAEVTEGATNASMEFDEEALAPTFRLISGIAGRSGGLEMAGRVGLPEEILAEARSRLSDAHRLVDQYLQRLQSLVEARKVEEARARSEREALESERTEARQRAREEEIALRARYEEAVSEALRRIGSAGEEIVKGVRERSAALQLKSEARKAAREAEEKVRPLVQPPAAKHLKPGDLAAASPEGSGLFADLPPGSIVRVRGLGTTGTIESVDAKRGTASIVMRGKKLTVTLADCDLVQRPEPSAARTPPVIPRGVSLSAGAKESLPAEINLIGRTVEEATGLLDKFLDDALLAGHREIRIIHGHGTGRLRSAIASFLSEHPLIASHHLADARSGGAGATIAVLRE